MRYFGGKALLAKHVSTVVEMYRKPGQLYVEPFAGACSVLARVGGDRVANDINHYVMATMRAVRDGWLPPSDVSEETYRDVMANTDRHPPELVGFVGVACAFAGIWSGSYARGAGRNYAAEGSKSLERIAPRLQGVRFEPVGYQHLDIPDGAFVYCDPPYAGTRREYIVNGFDHGEFWPWVKALAGRGCTVLVSEFSAPEWAEVVWEKSRVVTSTQASGPKRIEKLYLIRRQPPTGSG